MQVTRIVVANGPGVLDNGKEVILFPSRWDSGVPRGHKPFSFFPYELALTSTLLKRELPGEFVRMVDGNLHAWDGNRYAHELKQLQPDVLVCELSALTYPTMTRVMQAVRPARAILCGPMGGYDKERALRDGWTDVVVGEYELKVLELLGGTVPAEAKTAAGYVSLDWLPWAEDEDVSRIDYYECNHYVPPAVVQLYTTRGCPLSCSFCVVPTYYNGHGKSHKSHRTRDPENVADEIEYLAAKYPTFKGNYFNDEAHNANADWLVDFCETLIRRGLNKYYYDAMCGYWTMTEELVALMARAGYKQFRFGVESTSEVVGKRIGKTMHLERVERLLGWLKKYDVGAYITLQVGAMGSTEQTDLATIADAKNWIRQGLVQKWQLSTSTPQLSTPFYDLCKKNGWLITENPEHFDGWNATVSYPDYPAARIQHVRNTAGL